MEVRLGDLGCRPPQVDCVPSILIRYAKCACQITRKIQYKAYCKIYFFDQKDFFLLHIQQVIRYHFSLVPNKAQFQASA